MKIYPQNQTDIQNQQPTHIPNSIKTQSFQPIQSQNPMTMHSYQPNQLQNEMPLPYYLQKINLQTSHKYQMPQNHYK